jgi:hypothetical protein
MGKQVSSSFEQFFVKKKVNLVKNNLGWITKSLKVPIPNLNEPQILKPQTEYVQP